MENTITEIKLNELSEKTREKYELISQGFEEAFNAKPSFFARAPGRVNLIGEHIDYCGYSVLPMAIEHDITIAASPNHKNACEIHLTNLDSANFNEFKTSTTNIQINKSKPQWHDYFLSGYQGIVDKFSLEQGGRGMNIFLCGQVPKSAGLSSSSALVVCAALTTLYVNNLKLTKTELAEICADAERHVGTQGGGMDQAISCTAEVNSAKLIDFNPLKSTNISLPNGTQFVITNCCVEINKAASNTFNTRVAECKLSAQVLAKSQNLDWRTIRKPIDLQNALKLTLPECISLAKRNLHDSVYTISELCAILETDLDELALTSLSQNTVNVESFDLRNRILHVFSEAQRVYDFQEACLLTPLKAFKKLGELMNESHESCRDMYDCSCEELDELTEICRQSGAYGSRLTGAGWGGCAVSFIPHEKLDEFLESVKKLYYSKSSHRESKFENAAFATKPSEGIKIVLP